jgi:hypothetical protein
MTRDRKLLFAGVTVAAVGLAAAGAIAQRPWGHQRHGFNHGAGMGIMGLGFGGGPPGRVCRGEPGEMADIMLVRLEHKVKPTDAQKGAFEEFKTAARTAADKLRAGCPQPAAGTEGPPKWPTPIERLAQAQTGLEASLDALKTYRPAAEKFYAQLSDEQKAKLNERRGGGQWKWHRDRGPDDKGSDGPGPADGPAPDDKG